MKLKDLTTYIEELAPLSFQESYDNAGLIVGHLEQDIFSALITLDITEAVIEEAIHKKANVIISHHPIIFSGLKKLNGKNYVERCVIKAIKHDIALYAAHTNIDSVHGGVNSKLCQKIGLQNCRILSPEKGQLRKLVTFVPFAQATIVRGAIFEAGAGHIGEYDCCSFNIDGTGSFRGSENSTPFVGTKGTLHYESEVRIETIYPSYLEHKILSALFQSHPYEEVAYDIYPLENRHQNVGSGMIGYLSAPEEEINFLRRLKQLFGVGVVRHTQLLGKPIQTVALCGGSGSFLLSKAIDMKADIFISGDFTYHKFFDAENKIIIADIGHYESEQFTKELFYEIITKKFVNFAVQISETNTNPIHYL